MTESEKQIKLKNVAELRIRYAETDKMGIVYNGEYLTYFEVARVELMRSIGLPYSVFESKGFQLPLIEAKIKYLKPAFFDDLVEVEAKLNFELNPRMTINYELRRENETLATGYTVHSYFNTERNKPSKPPKFFVEAIRKAGEKLN